MTQRGNANVSGKVSPAALESDVQRLLDLEAIRQLAGDYPIPVDSHDVEGLVGIFTEDGRLSRAGGVYRGRSELTEFFWRIVATLSVTMRTVNQHLVEVTPGGAAATGVQMRRAEVAVEGDRALAAYRYDNEYRKVGDRWQFASRVMPLPVLLVARGAGSRLAGA